LEYTQNNFTETKTEAWTLRGRGVPRAHHSDYGLWMSQKPSGSAYGIWRLEAKPTWELCLN